MRIYTSREVQKIYDSGMISFETHMLLRRYIRPGISTYELDKIAANFIESKGAKPAFLGLYGYPACLCTSVNDVVVHGLPKKECILKEGDIISIDLGVLFRGYYSDTAWTWPVGEISERARRLLVVTQECLFRGIKEAIPGNRIGAISEAIQRHAEGHGYGVVRQLVGHGVGKAMHEEPQVPNFGRRRDGIKIRHGMVLAIEPMINEGTYDVYTDEDSWTIRTKDGKLSAHFEHTVAVTANGPLICTLPKGAETDVFALMQAAN
ncbi:MAG: type I methionyl aminopeptidase [Leptospiraceae bacterium]|nr:type I methionyl aminopeptidase [Leptospiraceae bacterium]MDW8306061.1 type I methionyl aminopeptidase [Leptospiraceae bacterium]